MGSLTSNASNVLVQTISDSNRWICFCGYRTLQVGQRPEAPCMSHCNCYTSSVSPVCGSNGVTYLSSCFAGCTRAIRTGPQSSLSQVISHLIYTPMFVCLPLFLYLSRRSVLRSLALALISWTADVQLGSLEWSPHPTADILCVGKDTVFCPPGILMGTAIWTPALITIQSKWFQLEQTNPRQHSQALS